MVSGVTPHRRASWRITVSSGVTAIIGAGGLYFEIILAE